QARAVAAFPLLSIVACAHHHSHVCMYTFIEVESLCNSHTHKYTHTHTHTHTQQPNPTRKPCFSTQHGSLMGIYHVSLSSPLLSFILLTPFTPTSFITLPPNTHTHTHTQTHTHTPTHFKFFSTPTITPSLSCFL